MTLSVFPLYIGRYACACCTHTHARISTGAVVMNVPQPLTMGSEPLLPEIPYNDRVIVRNVIYMAWALGAGEQMCIGWNVQVHRDAYIISMSLCPNFSISIRDLQCIMDTNPGRITSISVCGIPGFDGNNSVDASGCMPIKSRKRARVDTQLVADDPELETSTGALDTQILLPDTSPPQVASVSSSPQASLLQSTSRLVIKVMNQDQPVTITDVDVVRIRRRTTTGLMGAIFGTR